ncbi:MAG TPA: hypothetical protein VL221_12610 [Bacteroidota bacterium]|nr:hypothetical protein [Bacteroidota bacterium]
MTAPTPFEQEASKTLDVLGSLGLGGAPRHFTDGVMHRLPAGKMPGRGRLSGGARVAIAALLALAALNAAAIMSAGSRSLGIAREAAVDSLAVEYDLTPRTQPTWE